MRPGKTTWPTKRGSLAGDRAGRLKAKAQIVTHYFENADILPKSRSAKENIHSARKVYHKQRNQGQRRQKYNSC